MFFDALDRKPNDTFKIYEHLIDIASAELSRNLHSQQDFFEILNAIVERLPNSIQDKFFGTISWVKFIHSKEETEENNYETGLTRIRGSSGSKYIEGY